MLDCYNLYVEVKYPEVEAVTLQDGSHFLYYDYVDAFCTPGELAKSTSQWTSSGQQQFWLCRRWRRVCWGLPWQTAGGTVTPGGDFRKSVRRQLSAAWHFGASGVPGLL